MKGLESIPNIAVIAWGLTAMTLLGPVVTYGLDPILRWIAPGAVGSAVFGPLVLLIFLLYAAGKFVCLGLGISVLILCFSPAASLRVKSSSVAAGAAAVALNLYWIHTVQHSW